MNVTQKTLRAILGLGLVALLSNSALAADASASTQQPAAHTWHKDGQDCHADFLKKHMAKLHDALKLSADQEGAWANFLAGMKPDDMAKDHDKAAHQDWHAMSTPDKLDRMLDRMKAHEARLAEHAANVRTFYNTLSADQQKTFDQHFMHHHRDHFHVHRHGDFHPSHDQPGKM